MSVRGPLALALFLVIAAVVALTEWLVLSTVEATWLQTAEASLRNDCEFIANLMRRHMDNVALTELERRLITEEMAGLSLRTSSRICVVNWKGDVLEGARRPGEQVGDLPEVQGALHGRTESLQRGDVLSLAVPLLAADKVAGAIYGERSLLDLQLLLYQLRERLYGATLGCLAGAVLLSLGLARLLTWPLARLTKTVQRFGAGHPEERAQVRSRDEIGTLALAFNEMADSLNRQHQQLLQFVSDASHELRTPLASLRSLQDALEGGALEDPPTARRFLAHAGRELDRMEALVRDLLELHRELLPNLQRLNLREFLEDVTDVELDCPDHATITADPDRLAQIVRNLVGNARRAAPDGKVVVRAKDDRLEVEDDGVGLTPEQCERIFDRFYRTDASRARDAGGSGLGLAISRRLAEAMGFTLHAESEGPGRGARFILQK